MVMPDQFLLKPLPSIRFGAGSIATLPEIAASHGTRCLIITGSGFLKRAHQWPLVEKHLLEAGCNLFYASISGEPTPDIIDGIVDAFRPRQIEVVIAIGGGSVVDGGKAVSAMLPDGEPVAWYLEGVGSRKPTGKKLPFIAMPTTAGTGSEATANAVVTRPGADGFKKSLRHDRYVPDHAVVDPDLTRTCPPELTASCAMDAFTQLVEGYLSSNSSQITDTLAWEGLKNVQRSLLAVFIDGDDIDARTDMAFASLCSGITLANAGLGVVHGLAPPLGSLFSISHGVVCGTLMASANRATLERLHGAADENPAAWESVLQKYARLDRLFCAHSAGDDHPGMRFVEYLDDLAGKLAMPRLSRFGVSVEHLDEIVAGSSNKNNPIRLDDQALRAIVSERL